MSARNTALVWDYLTGCPDTQPHVKVALLALAEVASDEHGASAINGMGLQRLQVLTGMTVMQVEEFYKAAMDCTWVLGKYATEYFDMQEVCRRVVEAYR